MSGTLAERESSRHARVAHSDLQRKKRLSASHAPSLRKHGRVDSAAAVYHVA